MTTLPVTNPRTGEVDHHVPVHDRAHVTEVANRLRRAQPAWEALGPERRARALEAWAEAIGRYTAFISDALTVDTGRRLFAFAEISSVQEWLRYWARRGPELATADRGGTSAMAPSVHWRHQLKPYPLVGIISPWNMPLVLGLIDMVPALMAGCAVLLKPSEVTPRFAGPLERSVQAVPELRDVVGIVTGGPETGEALIDSADAVCFTGSVPTGREVAVRAARNFVPAFLELGGKDPAVVLEGADLDNAANAVLRSAVGLTGQACQSLERIYVQDTVFDAFLEALVAKAEAVEINWPDIGRGHVGPFIYPPQVDRVQRQIDDAVARGATVHCGGKVEDHGGKWCPATVLSGVTHDMEIMREETFGPVMPVMPFGTVDEAVELANDSDFGLGGAVFSGDREQGEAVARRLVGGAISVNDAGLTGAVHDVEKNSFCRSGMGGSCMGDAGLLRFFRKQAILYQSEKAKGMEAFDESQMR